MYIRLLSLLGMFAALALVCSAASDAKNQTTSVERVELIVMCGVVGLREAARSHSVAAHRQASAMIPSLARAPASDVAPSDALARNGGAAFCRN